MPVAFAHPSLDELDALVLIVPLELGLLEENFATVEAEDGDEGVDCTLVLLRL